MNLPGHLQLTIVLAVGNSYDVIRKTVRFLLMQSIREELELVIVTPSAKLLDPDTDDLARFGAWKIVETGVPVSIGKANAAGIRQASARAVVMAEDHAFPEENWASALVQAHQSSWAAVGPRVRNANPGSLVSWADFLIGYGPWMVGTEPGDVQFLPGHNTSYKRDILLQYGAGLEAMMEAETVLHWDLKSKGYEFHLDENATIRHWNFSRLSSWLTAMFYSGRVFAGSRMQEESWTGLHRFLYITGSPLIPVVRFTRLCPKLSKTGKSHGGRILLSLMLVPGLLLDGLGQMLGYVLGVGNAKARLVHLEYDRGRHLNKADRVRWQLLETSS
jgi:hypothetical protein